jgi:hypothetical protein
MVHSVDAIADINRAVAPVPAFPLATRAQRAQNHFVPDIVVCSSTSTDEQRISADAPLARAVLGRHTGERVQVAAPSGPYECVILHATRR